jgi:hypothetical protein
VATLDLILLIVATVAILAGAVAMLIVALRWLRGTEPRGRRRRPTRHLIRKTGV